jgi:hypothetical protein
MQTTAGRPAQGHSLARSPSTGYDGFLYLIGFLVAWLIALLLVELLRNTGRYTMGDVLAYRMRRRPVRAAAAASTLVGPRCWRPGCSASSGSTWASCSTAPPSAAAG